MPPPSLAQEDINSLNRRFAIPGLARVVAGEGGLAKVEIDSPHGSAEIYLQGAQLTRWKPAGGSEVIFLSRHSHWQPGKAIRGGVPICFPWFRAKADDPKAPAHGFARTTPWQLQSITKTDDGTAVALSLMSSEATRRWWPYEFEAVFSAHFAQKLTLELAVRNAGDTAFKFEEALHTYHRVGDAQRATVAGLDGTSFLDNRDGNQRKLQSGPVHFSAATDNAYLDTASSLTIDDPASELHISIAKRNSLTTVVWNPWREGAAALADMGDGEWKDFVCVEASNILDAAVTLKPGETHTMAATISIAKS